MRMSPIAVKAPGSTPTGMPMRRLRLTLIKVRTQSLVSDMSFVGRGFPETDQLTLVDFSVYYFVNFNCFVKFHFIDFLIV